MHAAWRPDEANLLPSTQVPRMDSNGLEPPPSPSPAASAPSVKSSPDPSKLTVEGESPCGESARSCSSVVEGLYRVNPAGCLWCFVSRSARDWRESDC